MPFVRYASGTTDLLPAPAAGAAYDISGAGIIVGEVHEVVTGGVFVNVQATIWSQQCFGACCG